MPSSDLNPKKEKGISIQELEITDLESIKERRKLKGNIENLVTRSTAVQFGGQNIVTVDVPKKQKVDSFSPEKIKDSAGVRYSDVVSGIKDPTVQKNSRFQISELTRVALSVEAEEEARIEAEIQMRLSSKLTAIREEISKTAYKEGYEAGKSKGQEEVLAASKPLLEDLNNLILSFENMRTEIFKANEEFVMRMVYQISKSILLKEIKQDQDYVRRLVMHLLDRVGTKENIKVYVSEKEFSSAEQLKQGLAQSIGELKNISIELDSAVSASSGGCRIETEFGEVDATLEVQIENIAQAFGVHKNG